VTADFDRRTFRMASLKKPPAWLITSAVAGSLAAYAAFFIAPGQRTITRLKRELTDKKQFLASHGQQSESLAQCEDQMEQCLRHINRWRQASPQEPNLVEFLGRLAVIAANAGVRMNKLTPQPPIAMVSIRQHPLSLELEGDFTQLLTFLGNVEEMPETIWIRNIYLRPDSQDKSIVQCELTLTVFADNREISG
jgi:Tfp pilus assembly protein PilO